MPKKPIAKTMRAPAERAAEWYLREVCGCVVTRRAVRTRYQSVDFFACDIMGKRENGSMVWAQVTAGGPEALRVRRRKLEKIPWHSSDAVIVLQLTSTPNPANARSKLWFFRVHRYLALNTWVVDVEAAPVKREWFKAWKEGGI